MNLCHILPMAELLRKYIHYLQFLSGHSSKNCIGSSPLNFCDMTEIGAFTDVDSKPIIWC